ncbi:MAG: hypothetical protein VW397_07865 [Candidatus Margulisiibacteriota bacterium]
MKQLIILLMAISSIGFSQTLNIVENEFVKIITGPEGFDHPRFSIETTGGDPSRLNDNNLPLIYGRPKPWTSYTSVAIDGVVYGFGTQTLKRAGKNAQYGQVIRSEVGDDAIVTTATFGQLKATQRLSLFRNPLTNVKDAVLIEYELKNEAKVTRDIGLRIMMDTMLGSNDAAPFRIGEEAIVTEKKVIGDQITDFWQSFDSLASPNIIAQGILRYAPANLTPPDELILMNWGTLADMPYRVQVNEGASFIREGEDEPDTALALFYEKRPLGPNQTRTYRTVMGLGGVTLAPGDLALGLTAPSTLAITDPNLYTIIAYISNTGGFTATNAKVELQLPEGLRLVKGQKVTDVSNILSGGSRQLMYVVKLDAKDAKEGTHKIELKVISESLPDQILNRDIVFKGQPRLILVPIGTPTIKRGFDQFVDVPFEVRNESEVSISNIDLRMNAIAPFEVPVFEGENKRVAILPSGKSQQVLWKLKVNEWWQGQHSVDVSIRSDYTNKVTQNSMINVQLGSPKTKLYYSQPEFETDEYGYLWITLIDMPTFSGLNLRLTWDPEFLKAIRVSPEPWLIESNSDILDAFVITENAMEIIGLEAKTPPWRMIVGKWHFKALKSGQTNVQIKQDDLILDDINISIRTNKLNLKEENDFDF